MAVNVITKFNWEKIVGRTDSAEAKRVLNVFRNKANEIAAAHAKVAGRAPEPVNFSAYKNKLKFTSSAVEALEKAYQAKKLPVFSAEVPELTVKKRAMLVKASEAIAAAAQIELASLNTTLADFDSIRITDETRVEDVKQRFPEVFREVEKEIKDHQWEDDDKN